MPKSGQMTHMTTEEWRKILLGIHPGLYRRRRLYRLLPSSPRCKLCNAPFGGVGSILMKFIGRGPYSKNPHFCGACLIDTEVGGVEIELSMLFADVRGSTSLAETMSPSEFSQLMNHFYAIATDILLESEAFIDKLVGDEVIGLYIPGFSGYQHARLAVQAAQKLSRVMSKESHNGTGLPIGIGVHTGIAYVGLVGTQGGISDLTALGDAMNTAARLVSEAGAGEVLISDAAYDSSGLTLNNLEHRQLDLKGKSESISARVIKASG
jgi:adenylate cyclase